jgi:hypothetical protein
MVTLFGCRFGRRFEQVAGNVVDDALLADVPTACDFIGHWLTLLSGSRHFPTTDFLPLSLHHGDLLIDLSKLGQISSSICVLTIDVKLQQAILDVDK